MQIVVTLSNSAGELDKQEITVRSSDGSFTLREIADALGDWPLADGDVIRIKAEE